MIWMLIVLESLSLAVVIGFLYVVLDRLITREYQHQVEIQAAEIQSLLVQRSTYTRSRIDEVTSNNSIGVSLLLGMSNKAEELIRHLYPPADGTSFYLRHASGDGMTSGFVEPAVLKQLDIDAIENPLRGRNSIPPSMLVFAKPVQRSGKILGHVIGIYNITEDSSVAEKVEAYRNIRLIARINEQYFDLESSRPLRTMEVPGKIRQAHAHAGTISARQEYWVPLRSFANLYVAASSAPLVQKRWHLIVYLVLLCLPLFGLTISVSFLILKKVTSSINVLARKATAIADASDTQELDEEGVQYEEFVHLAQAFNKVLSEVRSKTHQLKQHQCHLDKLVEERTAELCASNLKLKQTQAQMIQSEKMASIGQLAAGVAHEINNPIGFVNSNLFTLKEYCQDIKNLLEYYGELESVVCVDAAGPLSAHGLLKKIRHYKEEMDYDFVKEEMESVLDESKQGVERVACIVRDLKDFAHPDGGSVEYSDINRGIESTLNIVWNQLKYTGTLNKDLGDLPMVKCDINRMNQVFMNLLINAGQAIDRNGMIAIRTRRVDHQVEIVFTDNGCGIAPDVKSKIFDPFFTTKEVGSGTGLGLNLVYNIVKSHNGSIDVESKVGVGTTFTIRLDIDGSDSH